ncbi:MAG: HAMP domain-containing sensor histidine kinase, partial [Sediminibacterium sp.]|nr:HAMP domain-containing sensor histidine kinase [Sediminibacterium sp.]
MFKPKINKIKLVGILYWLLLLYIITALLFWYIKLENQHSELITYQINQLHLTKKNNPTLIKEIKKNGYKKTMQYTGEGIVFLIIIWFVAIYIYRIIQYEWKFATQQKNLLTALSHELKTPISILQINVQTLLKRELEKPIQQQLLLSMLEENKRLENISNNILLSNQLLSNNYVIFFDKINLSELIFQVIKRFSYHIDISNVNPKVENNLCILGDILLIEILINNVLDNALKYGNNKPIIIE